MARAAATKKRSAKRPVEYSILLTATLCLLAFGAVMVYSASSAESLLQGSGDPSFYLKRYAIFGLAGLAVLHFLARHGMELARRFTGVRARRARSCSASLVMVPGVGVTVNGATRWLGAGPLQFQPSELLKVALILYAAHLLASPALVGQDGQGAWPSRCCWWWAVSAAHPDEAARHGHDDGGLLRHRRPADRRRHADPQPGPDRRHAGRARPCCWRWPSPTAASA